MAYRFPAAIDYSWGRPTPRQIRDSGYLGAFRYLGGDSEDFTGHQGRDISKAELNALINERLLVGFVWETSANRVLSGRAGGVEDGQKANWYMDALGIPRSVPVIGVTVDFDAHHDQLISPIAEYARGMKASSAREVYPYGSYNTLEVLCGELKLFPCGWQCAAWSGNGTGSGGFIGGRRLSRYACMYQDVGYVLSDTSDHNIILMTDMIKRLAWNPLLTVNPQAQQKDEDDMASVVRPKKDSVWLKKHIDEGHVPSREATGDTYDFVIRGAFIKWLHNPDEYNAEKLDPNTQFHVDVPDSVLGRYCFIGDELMAESS